MTKTPILLAASAALTVALGLPAWSAMQSPAQTEAAPLSMLRTTGEAANPLILVDDDENDDDEGASMTRRASEGDGEDGDAECDDDEEGSCGIAAPAPARAGSVAPPQNGLFGTGTPQVQVK